MPNVVRLPGLFQQNTVQVVQDFDYADFCVLLEADTALACDQINGMTVLHYPRISIICAGDRCTSICAPHASIDRVLKEAHALLDAPCALAS